MRNKIQKQKSTKTLNLVSLMLVSIMFLSVFSISGFVMADDNHGKKEKDKDDYDFLSDSISDTEDEDNDSDLDDDEDHEEDGQEGPSIDDEDEEDDETEDEFDEVEKIQKISVEPKKQISEDGTAVYKIIVKDLHKKSPTTSVNETLITYTYKLMFSFESEGLSGEFETEKIVLEAGESEKVELRVTTEKKGLSKFVVTSTEEASGSEVKDYGLIYFMEIDEDGPGDVSFFVGKGYITNDEETEGYLLDLKILNKASVLTGKATIGKTTYRLEGSLDKTDVEFDLFSLKDKKIVGSFSGEAKNLGSFRLLKGDLVSFEEQDWKLTATSMQKQKIREMSLDKEKKVKGLSLEDIVVVVSSDAEEIYVKPYKVSKKKWFGFIPSPFGEKEVEVEITSNEKVFKLKIKAFGEKRFEKYNIKVGSLDDEDNIEIEIEEEI